MIRLTRFNFAFVLALFFNSVALSSWAETIRLVNNEYPPYSGASLLNKGLVTDIVTTVLTDAGYRVEIELVSWSRAMIYSQDGRADGIVGAWYTLERTNHYLYSLPYIVHDLRFLRLKETGTQVNNTLNLKAYTIGLIRDYAYQNEKVLNANTIYVNNFKHGIKMLKKKRIDLFPEDVVVAKYLLQQMSDYSGDQFDFVGPVLERNDLHFVISKQRKNAAEIIDRFNKSYLKIKNNGGLSKIFKRHNIAYPQITN